MLNEEEWKTLWHTRITNSKCWIIVVSANKIECVVYVCVGSTAHFHKWWHSPWLWAVIHRSIERNNRSLFFLVIRLYDSWQNWREKKNVGFILRSRFLVTAIQQFFPEMFFSFIFMIVGVVELSIKSNYRKREFNGRTKTAQDKIEFAWFFTIIIISFIDYLR